MRNIFRNIFFLALLVGLLTQSSFAQREILVPGMQSGGVIDGLALTILADSTARAAAGGRTTYVLNNGETYPIITTILNVGFFLHIKTADPTGAKAALVPSMKEDGGYNRIFEIRSDTKLENLIVEATRSYIDGALDNTRQNIRMFDGANMTAIGCVIAHDRKGDSFMVNDEGSSIFLEDCMLHSAGHFRDLGGNGRGIDARRQMDTISVVNSTFFNFTGSAVVDYFHEDIPVVLFDHNTVLNVGGPTFRLGRTHKSTVTNNIFANGNLWGTVPAYQDSTYVPEEETMYVMSLDTMETGWEIFVENNNVFWDQQYKDMWAIYSSVTSTPGAIQRTLSDNNSAPGDAYFEEALTFAAPPPSVYDYYAAAFADPSATIFPVNMYFGLASDIDLSYGTSAASYTAATGGYPLGDLNYYPSKKAEWDAAGRTIVTAVDEQISSIPHKFELSQNYPNPFNPTTNINFSIPEKGNYSLRVYNIVGQEIKTLLNGQLNTGHHNLTFDASQLSSGIYFYTLSGNNVNISRKMILMK